MPFLSEAMVLPLALAILVALGLGLWIDRREILGAARSAAALRWQAVDFWRGEAARFAGKPKTQKSGLIQLQLAMALSEAGLREPGKELLEEARAAATAAESILASKKNPADAMNAGLQVAGTTWQLGARDKDVRRLEEAESKLRDLARIYGEKNPSVSAAIDSDRGVALLVIGLRTGDATRLEEAMSVCRLADESPDCKPNSPVWVPSQLNLGQVLGELGDHRRDPALMREAIALLKTLLAGLDREKAPLEWRAAQSSLGRTCLALGELSQEPRDLEAAIAAKGQAMEGCSRESEPIIWAGIKEDLARAFWLLGEIKRDRNYLDKAHTAVQAALEIVTRENFPFPWAETTVTLGRVLEARGRLDHDVARLEQAAQAYGAALEVFEPFGPSRGYECAREGLERIRGALSEAGAVRDQGAVVRPTLDPDFA